MEFVSKSFHVIMKFLAMELYVFQDSQEGRLINVWSQSFENIFNIVEIFARLFKISGTITNIAQSEE